MKKSDKERITNSVPFALVRHLLQVRRAAKLFMSDRNANAQIRRMITSMRKNRRTNDRTQT